MKTKSLILLIAILCIFSSCNNESKVRLVDTSFKGEIFTNSAISFTFSDQMVPDTLVGVWKENEYLEISPEVRGRSNWQTDRKLVFIAYDGFPPSTEFTCKLKNSVFANLKNKVYTGKKEFSFHTPYLKVNSVNSFWHINESENIAPVLHVEIQFNQEINPKDAGSFVEIEIEKEKKEFKVVTEDNTSNLLLAVTDIKAEDKDVHSKILLKKGLKSITGGAGMQKNIEQDVHVPSPFKLNITDLQANHDGEYGTVMIYTTQKVDESSLKKLLKVSPSVSYTTTIEPNYIMLKGDKFNMSSKYELTIEKGLKGKIGGTLKHKYTQPFSFGEVRPSIKFLNDKAFYLSGAGSRNIEVALLNVKKVNIEIIKLYENNIINFLSSYSFGYSYDYEDYYYYGGSDPGRLGDVVYSKEVETNSLPKKGANRVLQLDFEDKLAEHKGIYYLKISSDEDYWLRANKLISISDIGLVVKNGKKSITVFTNSIREAKQLQDVELTFIGRNNQVNYTTKTDENGIALYSYDELKAPGFETTLIAAKYGDDYNVIPIQKTAVNTSRFDVGGYWDNPSGLMAYIYGDRNLYRPGETVNITGIIRDYQWNLPGSVPIILKMYAPNGKEFKTVKKVLNEHGSFETNITIPSSASTGSYSCNLYTGDEVVIGYYNVKIEEFMPDRIKVEIETDKKEYVPGEDVTIDIHADNFFGPPAANRNYRVEFNTKRRYFYSKQNRRYNFNIEGARTSFSRLDRDDKTDEEGNASESFNIPAGYRNMGLLQSDIFVTVFDETGRPVNRLTKVDIYTQDIFYGIRTEDYYVKTGQPAKFSLIAVDKNGEALNDVKADIKLIRHEYKTVLSKSGRYFRYRSEKVERVVEQKTIKLNGTSSFYSFIPDLSGRYELRVKNPEANTYVSNRLYAYGWGSTSYSSFKVNNEGQIDIELDKEKYEVGDMANILCKAPFSGKMLITVESDKVLDHYYVETDKRVANLSLEMKEEYLPNVYISATLFKPHEKSDIPLTVAHGFAPVKVDNFNYKIPVEIDVVEKSRSNTTQTIKIKSKPNTPVTVAVVDEGILQVSGYSTPNPYNFFYQKRALQVRTSDVYPYLFPEVGMIRSSTGAGDGEMAKRLNPMQNNRVKLVTFWSGIITTNGKGEAEYEIDIPQFSGDLRVMAVGYEGQSFGSAKANMKVADPLVLSVGLPRFLSPGDTALVPVIMTNTTDNEAKCKTILNVDGPIEIVGADKQNVTIQASREGEALFKIYTRKELGEATVKVVTSAMGEEFQNITHMPVRPSSPLQKRSGSGQIKAGSSEKINLNTDDFIESSINTKLLVSNNPLVQFSKSLDYLVRYPYGCVEQTTSAAFPQLYFSDLMGIIYKNQRAKGDAVHNVQAAIDRLKLMQLYDGGLTYWPGGGYQSWWGSVYAAHFIIEAEKAGYEVDPSFKKHLIGYLKAKLRSRETIKYYYNRTQMRMIAPRSAAYSLYVLALTGEKPMALLNYYRRNMDQLSLDSKYMLAGAYALTGDKTKFKEILPSAFEGEESVTSSGGSFYSHIRDEAIALNVLLEVDPENDQVGVMAKHISEALRNQRYLNTQERSFGFLAMGKVARRAAESDVSGEVRVDGKTVSTFKNSAATISGEVLKSKNIEISTGGNGNIYYFYETEGISATGEFEEKDSYLSVRKTLYNRNGQIITNGRVNQNDLVLVEIGIRGLTNTTVDNVAIADVLPAGFEIENPRLTELPPGMRWPNSKSYPQYTDIRDDRIIFFNSVRGNTRYYYYLVRAVSPGTFMMGPVGADAMYNGEYHSYHGAGVVTVTR